MNEGRTRKLCDSSVKGTRLVLESVSGNQGPRTSFELQEMVRNHKKRKLSSSAGLGKDDVVTKMN